MATISPHPLLPLPLQWEKVAEGRMREAARADKIWGGSRMQPILEMRNITKTFPGVKALTDVNLSVMPAESHAVVGENGAGNARTYLPHCLLAIKW